MIPKPQQILQIVYQTDPDKYEYLNKRIMEILGDFEKNGPSEEVLSKVKEYSLKTYTENQRSNTYFAGAMVSYLQDGVDFVTDYRKAVEGMTSADVAKSVKNLLKQGNFKTVVMAGYAE